MLEISSFLREPNDSSTEKLLENKQIFSFNNENLFYFKNNDFVNQPNESQKNTKSYYLYITVTETIERHLNHKQNVLCFIKNMFLSDLIEEMSEILRKFREKELKYSSFEKLANELINDFKTFIDLFLNSLLLFYNFSELTALIPDLNLLTSENLKNFITTIFFSFKKLSLYLLELEKILTYTHEQSLRNAFKFCERFQPQDFGVPSKFIFKKCDPFIKPIETFRLIDRQRSPVHKLRILIETSDKITESANDECGIIGNISGEDMLTIFIYIVMKSNLENLNGHLKIIEQFTSQNLLNSKAGYYFTTLQICVLHLENIRGEESGEGFEEQQSYLSCSVKNCVNEIRKTDFYINNDSLF